MSTYLHESGTARFDVVKRVNDGPWLTFCTGLATRDDAEHELDRGRTVHAGRCPRDRVDWAIQRVY